MTTYQFVGVDVSKDKFDVAVQIKSNWHQKVFVNSKKGYCDLINWLNKKQIDKPWVCMEATGHYSEQIADYLVQQSIQVSVINPRQIKHFGQATLSRNKTDPVDARLIAEFGDKMETNPFTSRDAHKKALKELINLLQTLKDQRQQLKNQYANAQSIKAKRALIHAIKILDKEIARIEKELHKHVSEDENTSKQIELLTSIKGIGTLTASTILANVPPIDRFNNAKEFAAYFGITPKQHQSGKYKGKTTISRVGDAQLRKALYMPAIVAKYKNKAMAPFVRRLEAKGKAKKSVTCAVIRKLTHWIFGVLKSNQPFQAAFA